MWGKFYYNDCLFLVIDKIKLKGKNVESNLCFNGK